MLRPIHQLGQLVLEHFSMETRGPKMKNLASEFFRMSQGPLLPILTHGQWMPQIGVKPALCRLHYYKIRLEL